MCYVYWKKAAIENEVLVEAFMKSDKTLEKAIAFLTENGVKEEPEDVICQRNRQSGVAEKEKRPVINPQKREKGRLSGTILGS